jgi:methionyl-tRNA formyltransferase
MKIILWTGNDPNQKALANKIHNVFRLDGIITETRHHKRKITVRILLEKVIEKIFLPSIGKSWWGMQKYYDKLFPNFPKVELLNVENINSDEAYEFSKKLDPDLIIVSGTRLIKEKMLSIKPKIGILNLHTGLSPYIKGGPNCTNWCIATKQFHLIGNTIMWIDLGIDTGNILTTEFTELWGNESLPQIHLKVMEHAHSLYIKSINCIELDKSKSIRQSEIAKGKTYYTKDWTLKRKIDLIVNFKKMKQYVQSKQIIEDRTKIKVIYNNNC